LLLLQKNKMIMKEIQHCFFADGYIFCNFVVRKDGTIVKGHGKMLRFPASCRNKYKNKTAIKDGDSE